MSEKFIKTRDYRGSFRLLKRLRRSKSSREYLAYRAMNKIGVPCPGGLELKDERNALGLLNIGELSMDRLENAVDLRFVCLLDEHRALISNPEFRRELIAKVAKWVRVMHENNFYHQNLNFRNVLVRTEPSLPVQVYFIDAASAKIKPKTNVNHYRKKELAFLYKDARAWFSSKEMMRFAHLYFGCKKLNKEQHALVVELIQYARSKWGDRSSAVTD